MANVFADCVEVHDPVDVTVTVNPDSATLEFSAAVVRALRPHSSDPAVTVSSNALEAPGGDVALIPIAASDGRLSEPAFTWKTGPGDCSLAVTFSGGAEIDIRECRFAYDSATPLDEPAFEYSSDGGDNWDAATATQVRERTLTGTIKERVMVWDHVASGPTRWRFARPSGTTASVFCDVRFISYGAAANADEYVIYDRRSGSRSEYRRSSSAGTFDVAGISGLGENGGHYVSLEVVAVYRGVESRGVTVTSEEVHVSGQLAEPESMASVGGRVIIAPATALAAALTTGATSLSVDTATLTNGDRVVLQSVVDGVQKTEYLAVTSAASGTGPYVYSITRNLAGGGASSWEIGTPVVSLGTAGAHFIDLYSARGLKSSSEVGPAIVGNVRNSATYNDWTPRWAIGNLNGLFGYATNIYGAAFGVPSGAWVKIDPTNGVRVGHNATTKFQVDASGNASFAGAITAASGTIGGWAIGASDLSSGNIKLDASGSGQISVKTSGSIGYGNPGTKFYVDGTGRFSLADQVLWDGTNLTVKSGNVQISPSVGVTITNSGAFDSRSLRWVSSGGTLQGYVSGSASGVDVSVDGTATLRVTSSAATLFGGMYVDCPAGVSVTAGGGSPGSGYFNAGSGYKMNGTKVVGAQGAASRTRQTRLTCSPSSTHGWRVLGRTA